MKESRGGKEGMVLLVVALLCLSGCLCCQGQVFFWGGVSSRERGVGWGW